MGNPEDREPLVLVVDDNLINLRLACDVLEAAGRRVARAKSAEEALAVIEAERPALILLDLALPGMDGISLARKLKSEPATRAIRLVALTASAMKGDEEKARAAGFDGYITKPIDTRALPRHVEDQLTGRAPTGPKRILVVEDQPQSRKLLVVTLRAEGYQVLEASDGMQGLALLEREPLDAVITDILMPNMDGFRLCYEIRSSERWYRLPVIVYTNTYTAPGDEEVALKLGADRYLRKPSPVSVIVDALAGAASSAAARTRTRIDPPDDLALLKSYSGRLVSKLEDRNAELNAQTRALAESNRMLIELTANIPEVFWTRRVGSAGFEYVSPAYELIWGRSLASLHENPRSWLDAIVPEDRARIEDAMEHVEAAHDVAHEYRIARPDGRIRYIYDRAFPIRDAAGRVTSLAGLAEDVTVRKEAEQAAARFEAQLHQAQKLEALGTLAGGIAHDFNNLLTAILVNAQLARARIPTADAAQENLQEIVQVSQLAVDLVRQILTFSRRREQSRETIQLEPVIREVVRLLRATLSPAIELRIDICADCPPVLADASQIHQVLMNLCSNAAHAMNGHGGRIEIVERAVTVDEKLAGEHPPLRAGEHVLLRVSDTGCGMDPAMLEHIFEPFFTTKGPHEGTGLGLPVVHGIVCSHDGAILVESAIGKGTTFDVYLPAQQGAEPRKVAASDVPRGHGECVVFLDDELAITTLAQQALRDFGYDVVAFTAPEEALARVGAEPDTIDLLITDLRMPAKSGLQVIEEVRAIRRDLPIVLTSGYAEGSETARAERLGVTDLLTKPFKVEELAQAVRVALDRARSG